MNEEITGLLDEAERKLAEAVPVVGHAMWPAQAALQEAGVAMGRAQLLLLRAFQEQVLHPPSLIQMDHGWPRIFPVPPLGDLR